MSKTNDGGPAFPVNQIDPSKGHYDGRYEVEAQHSGMSRREVYAAIAMHALIGDSTMQSADAGPNEVASTAFAYADAMLKAREETR